MKNALLLITLFSSVILHGQQPTKEQMRQVEDAKKSVRKMEGKPLPSFRFETLDGNIITLADAKGKILLINFWFTRCKPCIMEMPEMNKMVAEFKDEEILFLAPTFDDKDLVNSFLQKREFDYQIIPDAKDYCIELNIRSYPAHFIVNPEGIIEKVIIGYSSMTVESLRKSVRKLFKSE